MNSIIWPSKIREQHFQGWLQKLVPLHELRPESLQLASADASTRRYLRIGGKAGNSFIVMDAPPESNDVRPFIGIARHMSTDCGLHVPEIFAADETLGFLLLSDFGDLSYLKALQAAEPAEADRLMRAATQTLLQWQLKGDPARLPAFDESFVRRELQIFVDWCVEREYGRQWSETQLKWWEHSCKVLVNNIAEQAQVPMHRDFMPRNLMVCKAGDDSLRVGVLDFQDAVRGPIGYDLISLLRDTFISWDEEQELDWAVRYWEQARRAGLPVDPDFGEFWRQVELTGLQRHLKILGLFCRLKHRDGKPSYAEDLPRFFAYAIKVSTRYVQLSPLTHLLQDLQGTMVETGFTLR
ncbi:aminoglycoside phosphotransferase family protein [Roseateles oligotrophus]|uniref:Phosphotransferase n=1 Tax=Roseateles oligotrophus TaxID=1769250 RepID=A0ABT2YJS5_9BURK|nr:phosphotransferase [Roseateles oligotrophus]MCV2370307.1 phosphotransferase [Roseateles oligotrophus]